MKFNTLSKIFCLAGIIASPLSLANQTDAGISFTTVPDVSILQLQAIQFGGDMTLSLNDTCSLLVSAAVGPDEVDSGIAPNAVVGEAATFQQRGGSCDPTNAVDGTAGIYEVSGGAGVPVKITVNTLTGTNFNFVPTGAIGNYDGANTANGDSLQDITADTEHTVNLANVNDVINAAQGGSPQAGKTKIFVGGTLTASTALTAGTPYTEQFTIDVTY